MTIDAKDTIIEIKIIAAGNKLYFDAANCSSMHVNFMLSEDCSVSFAWFGNVQISFDSFWVGQLWQPISKVFYNNKLNP